MSEAAKASVEAGIRSLADDLRRMPPDVAWNRLMAFEAIVTELNYQDAQRGNAARHIGQPVQMHPGETLTYVRKCVRDAEEACYKGQTGLRDSLQFFRKAAALCVRVLAEHGAPLRV